MHYSAGYILVIRNNCGFYVKYHYQPINLWDIFLQDSFQCSKLNIFLWQEANSNQAALSQLKPQQKPVLTQIKNQVFHDSRWITRKRVTSLRGPSLRHCTRAILLLSKKCRTVATIETLGPIWPARDLNLPLQRRTCYTVTTRPTGFSGKARLKPLLLV